jgi:hypothetical protein
MQTFYFVHLEARKHTYSITGTSWYGDYSVILGSYRRSSFSPISTTTATNRKILYTATPAPLGFNTSTVSV